MSGLCHSPMKVVVAGRLPAGIVCRETACFILEVREKPNERNLLDFSAHLHSEVWQRHHHEVIVADPGMPARPVGSHGDKRRRGVDVGE
jgi:hypothetical protein